MRHHWKSIFFVSIVLVFAFINASQLKKDAVYKIDPYKTVASHYESFTTASLPSTFSTESQSHESVNARAAGVYSLKGESIDGWSMDKKWPIASITKLMTSVVASDLLPPNKTVTIMKEDIDLAENISGGFVAGDQFSVKDLIKAMLVVSNNTAAEAVARNYGRELFLAKMNEIAIRIGMNNTYFADPSGLSVRNQSTVADLEKLVSFILQNKPELLALTRTKTVSIYNFRTRANKNISNINQFAGRPDFIGGKTGTTPEAVGNLISVFSTGKNQGKIIILLGSEDRFAETEEILKQWL